MAQGLKEVSSQPERWLTTVLQGRILQQQRVPNDCMVLRLEDLPGMFRDGSVIPSDVVRKVGEAINLERAECDGRSVVVDSHGLTADPQNMPDWVVSEIDAVLNLRRCS